MKSRRLLFSIYFSNALEFFDYTLFGALTPLFQKKFFSHVQWISPQGLAVFAFCISLLVRPFGSLVFGYIGDKFSRILSIRLSILCMTGSSFMLACLPETGALAPYAVSIIFMSRILQGLSAGGEYNGAAIFALEEYQGNNNTISGFLTSSAYMGLVIASFVSYTLTFSFFPDYAWRFAFFLGGIIGIISLVLRSLRGSTIKQKNTEEPLAPLKNAPVFWSIFFIGGITSSIAYFIFVPLKTHFAQNPSYQTINLTLVFGFFLLIASLSCIVFGKLADRKNLNLIPIATKSIIFLFPFAFSGFYFSNAPIIQMISLLLLSICLGLHGSCQHAYCQKYAPQNYKQRFISIAYSLGTGLVTSFIIWIESNFKISNPAIVIFIYSFVASCSLFFIQLTEKRDVFPNSQHKLA